MAVNSDKAHLWKADVERSIDCYNDWFLRFAPQTYRKQRAATAKGVTRALELTQHLSSVTPSVLREHPEVLQILRMACAPPLARDRLMGLAHASKNLVQSMEGKGEMPPKMPPRMPDDVLSENLLRICETISELTDRDLFPWLDQARQPAPDEVQRAATVVADRLCGAISDPIVRNAQEQRQLALLSNWLNARGYYQVLPGGISDPRKMKPGSYAFRLNVPVGKGANSINVPVDCAIKPYGADDVGLPLLIEAKSAGDVTNTNKRRKEEAQKYGQLKSRYGSEVHYLLLLCGYFEPGYLGYEASEGIDWVWEHRLGDLEQVVPRLVPTESQARERSESMAYVDGPASREELRLQSQLDVDSRRSQESRNRLGQFSTPYPLAQEIVSESLVLVQKKAKLVFLEPALGTGVFFAALETAVEEGHVAAAVGVEIDQAYAKVAQELWPTAPFSVVVGDFLSFSARSDYHQSFDLICTNPPYVRHHHLQTDLKRQLQARVKSELGLQVSGLSGLYVYFVLLADTLLREGAVASWLIPSEFLYVNYGAILRRYLLEKVTLLRIHEFDAVDVQFADALVSSCIVTYAKRTPREEYKFRYSFGGTFLGPKDDRSLSSNDASLRGKWALRVANGQSAPDFDKPRVGELFDVKRGIATGSNGFFILDQQTIEQFQIPRSFLQPILPSPRLVPDLLIQADAEGLPKLPAVRFLLDCRIHPDILRAKYPGVWEYLSLGEAKGLPATYLCSRRRLWYLQERREPPLFLATYMGRSRSGDALPFRFFLNLSRAIATNVFLLLYPKEWLSALLRDNVHRMNELLDVMNALELSTVVQGGRTYGGGLHKLEPAELANLPLPRVPAWLQVGPEPELSIMDVANL